MIRNLIRFFLATSTIISASTLLAHRHWLLPSTTVLSGVNQWISVEGAVSNDLFFPNHVAIPLALTIVTSPSGAEVPLQHAAEGKIRSSFEVLLEEQGTYRIRYRNQGLFARWTEDGEMKRWRGSKETFDASGVGKKPGVQLLETNGRVDTYVTCGTPDTHSLTIDNEGLELVFKTHPNDFYVGESAELQFLIDGQPVSGLEVSLIAGNDRFRDTVDEMKFTTNDSGLIEIKWPHAGRFWLSADKDAAPSEYEGLPMNRMTSYTVTLEVLPL
jgi:hypothetical protein